jgi:hypothetical protein
LPSLRRDPLCVPIKTALVPVDQVARFLEAVEYTQPLATRILKKAQEFEDDHDDDNHANDVKDVSVHVRQFISK